LVAGAGRGDLTYPKAFDSLRGSSNGPSACLNDDGVAWFDGVLVNYAYEHDSVDWWPDVEDVLHREGERSI